jgi:hypothetical protein
MWSLATFPPPPPRQEVNDNYVDRNDDNVVTSVKLPSKTESNISAVFFEERMYSGLFESVES